MLPLALLLAAAPVMPEAAFPKPVKAPLEIEVVDFKHPLESSKALALAAPLLAWRSQLQLPSTYQLQPEPTLDAWDTMLWAPARVTAGACTEWVLFWNAGKMGTSRSGVVVVTSKADRVAVDAVDVANTTIVVQAAESNAKTTIQPNGTIATETTRHLIGDDMDVPENAHSAFEVIEDAIRLKPDCTFESPATVHRLLSGFVTDASSKERLFINDDGKTTVVHYSSKPNTWAELTVEKLDRKAGTLTVLFPKSKSRHTLKWNDTRTELTCGNPDGTTQLFR